MGHAHTHSHRSGDDQQPEVGLLARTVVILLLLAAAAASVVGVVRLWPDSDRADALTGSVAFAAQGVSYPQAEVMTVQPACPLAGEGSEQPGTPVDDDSCGHLVATISQGADRGREVSVQVPPEVSASGLGRGDTIEVQLIPPVDDQPGQAAYFGTERSTPLVLLLGAFGLVVILVARWRGLMALLGLAFSGAVVTLFLLPALLTGEPPVAVAVAGSTAIMFVVLFTTHGLSLRTATALVGTLAGVAVSGLVALWAVDSAHLTGVSDETGSRLYSFAGALDFQGLLVAAIIIAGLGVLNDVTITQASAVWELRGASPGLSRREVFTSAMRIGRDHIASTIYTIVFAYAGTALTLLLVISLFDRPVLDLVGTEELASEVVRSLASSIGLVLAVPLTTLIAALTVGRAPSPPSRPAEAARVSASAPPRGPRGRGERPAPPGTSRAGRRSGRPRRR